MPELWYVRRNGSVKGPFKSAIIARFIEGGRIKQSDELSRDRAHWETVASARARFTEAGDPAASGARPAPSSAADTVVEAAEADTVVEPAAEADTVVQLAGGDTVVEPAGSAAAANAVDTVVEAVGGDTVVEPAGAPGERAGADTVVQPTGEDTAAAPAGSAEPAGAADTVVDPHKAGTTATELAAGVDTVVQSPGADTLVEPDGEGAGVQPTASDAPSGSLGEPIPDPAAAAAAAPGHAPDADPALPAGAGSPAGVRKSRPGAHRRSRLRRIRLQPGSPKDRIKQVASLVSVMALIVVGGLAFIPSPEANPPNCNASPGPGVNWSNCQLERRDLSQAKLGGALLRNARLREANLFGAVLTRADLAFAELSEANLSYAGMGAVNAIGANFRNANLSYADLENADLSHADLRGANLGRVEMRNAKLDHAIWIDGRTCHEGSVGGCRLPVEAPTG